MKPCPFCGAMLAAALVAAIVDPFRDESCPRRPKRERKVDALVNGPHELVPGEFAAKRLVALALLGASVRASTTSGRSKLGDGFALRALPVVKPDPRWSLVMVNVS